jgi:hypothetical protein
MAAVGFIVRSASPGYVMLNSLKDSLLFPDVSSCYCNSCHKIRLYLHWSLVHQALQVPPSGVKSGERGGQVIGPPRPIHLLPNVSSKYSQATLVQCAGAPTCWNHISRRTSKGFIQILTDDISAVCRGAITLEPHSRRTYKGTTSSSSGKVAWRNVR